MKWAAPSCYKTAAGSLSKCSTRRIKYLATASSRPWPGIGCGTVGTEVGRLGAVLYRGGGGGKARNALMTKGIVQGGGSPTVRKHGMDGPRNLAPDRGQPRLLDQCATSSAGCTTASAPSRPTSTGSGASSSSTGSGAPRRSRPWKWRRLTHLAVQVRSPRPPEPGAERHRVLLPAGIEKGNSAGWSMGEVGVRVKTA